MAVAADSLAPMQPSTPLVQGAAGRVFAFGGGAPITAGRFIRDARRVAAALPESRWLVNLCEDRYAFLVTFAAAILRGQVNLLPSSRAPEVVADVIARHPGAQAAGDARSHAPACGLQRIDRLLATAPPADGAAGLPMPRVPLERLVAIGFTSGSTGAPRPQPKTWGGLLRSNAGNLAGLGPWAPEGGAVVATVPPQHMYGVEMSVLLPMLGPFSIHAGRPFFPDDVRAGLAAADGTRVLVSTPVHLRALLASGIDLPPLAAIVSATAPLPQALAVEVEAAWGAPVVEVFGSTETCVIAQRRTAATEVWTPREGVNLHPQPDGVQVEATWLERPVVLQDLVEPVCGGGFRLHGRATDLLEVAGKRASLADLTRRLLAVPGVLDGVVLQQDRVDARGVRPIVAAAVAPGLCRRDIVDALRGGVDPVFLPRRLRLVDALPRNETGKLPREAILALFE
ncbi:AMP-binding protein [Coralloluteibacterium thermophilus]|uniref:AMP-binding protein n=1 Tax=Coralloluteibacterium thermophilum TaxID=2707049 RepID=A0ABV9NHA3_9GAMM